MTSSTGLSNGDPAKTRGAAARPPWPMPREIDGITPAALMLLAAHVKKNATRKSA